MYMIRPHGCDMSAHLVIFIALLLLLLLLLLTGFEGKRQTGKVWRKNWLSPQDIIIIIIIIIIAFPTPHNHALFSRTIQTPARTLPLRDNIPPRLLSLNGSVLAGVCMVRLKSAWLWGVGNAMNWKYGRKLCRNILFWSFNAPLVAEQSGHEESVKKEGEMTRRVGEEGRRKARHICNIFDQTELSCWYEASTKHPWLEWMPQLASRLSVVATRPVSITRTTTSFLVCIDIGISGASRCRSCWRADRSVWILNGNRACRVGGSRRWVSPRLHTWTLQHHNNKQHTCTFHWHQYSE